MNRRHFLEKSSLGYLFMMGMPYLGRAFVHRREELPYEQPFRQIHLDFHTSRFIEEIGAQFDPEEFAATLQKARVNSINCFARGHHGWIYFDTKKFPERRHPHLKTNLLAEQVEACHKKDIKVPAYITLQADYYTFRHHPEWQVVGADGKTGEPFATNFWQALCLNTPYVDFLKMHVQEILETIPVDGLWLDIIKPRDCACRWCIAGMEEKGMDPTKADQRLKYGELVIYQFMDEMSGWIRKIKPECLIYYNSGHIAPFHRQAKPYFTHFELESLSSSEKWGYPFFQNEARYARTLGKEIVGMTGKFHSVWGDFHSFKNKAALEFDCFLPLALNARCSIGDQLHPSGKIDPVTYDLIGSVYSQVEKKEPWCTGAEAVTEIAVFTPEEFRLGIVNDHPPGLWGANRVLIEGGFQYDVIDTKTDFSRYKVLILPDHIPVDQAFSTKLEQFISNGGAVLASFESGLGPDGKNFTSSSWGVTKAGDGPVDKNGELARGRNYFNSDYAQYVIPQGAIGKDLPETEHVMYLRGMDVETRPGSEVLVYNTLTYFDREYPRFSSHRQAPSSGKQGYPAIVKNGNLIYFSHPVFSQYNQFASIWVKTLVHNALDLLLPERILQTNGPSSLITALNHQPENNRYVLHLLHYIPERRGLEFDTIEDVIPLHDLEIDLMIPGKQIRSVRAVPDGPKVGLSVKGKRSLINLPVLNGHQMIELRV